MNPAHLRLATLNLWRFDEWEKRLPKLIEAIRTADPDAIFFQEVERDPDRGLLTQMEILNQSLGYPHVSFARACVKTSRKGVPLLQPIDYGLGVLSRLPFTSETIFLAKAADEKEQQIVMDIDISAGDVHFRCFNVHFSNTDAHAESNFREMLRISESRGDPRIIAGDLNIKDMASAKPIYGDGYISSSELYSYVSYPKDGVSYDQVLLPKGYVFKDFSCMGKGISDHRMLVATISRE